jgi:hypothetical protein
MVLAAHDKGQGGFTPSRRRAKLGKRRLGLALMPFKSTARAKLPQMCNSRPFTWQFGLVYSQIYLGAAG